MKNIEDRPIYKQLMKVLRLGAKIAPRKTKELLVRNGEKYMSRFGMFFFWQLIQNLKLQKE